MLKIAATEAAEKSVLQLALAGLGSQVLRSLAHLSIAEHLDAGPLSAVELAERTRTDTAHITRLLRAATALGLIRYRDEDEAFETTSALRILHGDAEASLKHVAIFASGPAIWLPGLRLSEAVTQGRAQTTDALGVSNFEYFARNPDEARVFEQAMTELSAPVIDEAVPLIDVVNARSVVDVGGSQGIFVERLLQRQPQLSGVVFDLPHVIEGNHVDTSGRRAIPEGIAGDFFEFVPPADIYLLKFILHDWDDPHATTILTNVRAAMNPAARLYIVEMVIEDDAPSVTAALFDMVMMFALGGKERSLSEYDALLASAGLARRSIRELSSGYAIIEATAGH